MGAACAPAELEEVPMPIVGGLDIHRKQITFDYLDTVTGQVRRGQVAPADRAHLRAWLARFAGRDDVAFAVEACTGWRYIAEELAAAGIAVHLAEPADTAFARGRKRHAKTDKTDSRHLRMLLAEGRLPECWIPPGHILEARALLELYHDLRAEHTAWVQRIHAVLFHHGAPALGAGTLRTGQGVAALQAVTASCLSPAGQLQISTALEVIEALEARMHAVRHQLLAAARHLTGAKVLAARLYGVGPFAALAMTCWLAGEGRFSSSRQAVRFAGLDVTVWSSDRKGPPGRLSRQGPPVLRWAVYEAGQTHARSSARTTATTPPSRTARTASAPRCPRPARSSGRPATSWPSSATTRSPPPETSCHADQPVTAPARPGLPQPRSPDGDHRGQLPPSRCQPLPALPGGRPD